MNWKDSPTTDRPHQEKRMEGLDDWGVMECEAAEVSWSVLGKPGDVFTQDMLHSGELE